MLLYYINMIVHTTIVTTTTTNINTFVMIIKKQSKSVASFETSLGVAAALQKQKSPNLRLDFETFPSCC